MKTIHRTAAKPAEDSEKQRRPAKFWGRFLFTWLLAYFFTCFFRPIV